MNTIGQRFCLTYNTIKQETLHLGGRSVNFNTKYFLAVYYDTSEIKIIVSKI